MVTDPSLALANLTPYQHPPHKWSDQPHNAGQDMAAHQYNYQPQRYAAGGFLTVPEIYCWVKALLLCAVLSSAVLITSSGHTNGPELPKLGTPGDDVLPAHKERELGNRIMREVRNRMNLLNDVEINHYIQELGYRLVNHSNSPDFGYHFFVVDNSQINAFALPGGNIGIHTGLIRKTESESELAGVIAHEIAHVTERHIARQIAQSQRHNLQTAASILAAILIGSYNPQAGTAAAMAGIAAPIQQQLSYSRTHEREADRIGVENLAAANLDPQGMPRFFERLAKESRYADKIPEYMRTHPLTEKRIREARRISARLEGNELYESGHHPFIRARLEVLAHLENPESTTAQLMAQLEQSLEPPQRAGATYGLALAVAHEDEKYAQALALLDNLQAIDGERLYVLLGRAEILRMKGERQEALQIYKRALSLYPGNSAAIYRKAETLLAIGEADRARRILANASRHSVTNVARLMRLYAEAAHASGNKTESYIAYARYHYQRGDINMALSQLDNAMRYGDNEYQQAKANALYDRWRKDSSNRSAQQ